MNLILGFKKTFVQYAIISYKLKTLMEVSFSPPNLKRIGYPKNTIYMTNVKEEKIEWKEEKYGRLVPKNEIIIEDLMEEDIFSIAEKMYKRGKYNLEYWKAPQQKSGHLHIRYISLPEETSTELANEYRILIVKKYVREELWDKVDWNFYNRKEGAEPHRIVTEDTEHYKGYGIKSLVKSWGEIGENPLEEKIFEKAKKNIKDNNIKNLGDNYKEEYDDLINKVIPHWIEGNRQNVCLYLAGYLRKNKRLGIETTKAIISKICSITEDKELKMRLTAIEETYKKDEKDIKGISGLDFLKEQEEETKEKTTLKGSSLNLMEMYYNIIEVLKYYCDIEEKYYSLISLWIIGTYYHDEFPTYPYLFFNAMRGSGKSRVLRLVTYLSKEGSMLNSLTEAVLFRTTGTLGIDEFEGIGRKGNEALKELLNSAYKKGITIKRMKKQKSLMGEEMVVEEFVVYRPILMANISGMEEVLGDRCLQVILSKSSNSRVTKKVENYENDTKIKKIKQFQREKCRLCSDVVLSNVYEAWNEFVNNLPSNPLLILNDTNNTTYTHTTNDTNSTIKDIPLLTTIPTDLFTQLNNSGIDGRNLELMLPLIIIAYSIDENIFNEITETLKEIVQEKKKEDMVESIDIALYDFISQQMENKWYYSKDLLKEFKHFIQSDDEWLNERWFGKGLKRLSLIKDKKRMNYGKLYILDINKAQDKIRMFK